MGSSSILKGACIMIEIKQESVSRDAETGKFVVGLAIKVTDHNVETLKAKAKLYAGVMSGLGDLIEAKLVEFERRRR